MKKKNKALIIIGAVLSVVLILVGSLAIKGTCRNKYEEEDFSNNWMSYIKDEVKINEIVIPGSHDAGTSGMVYLGETQTYTIKQQLQIGTRYFDIRVNKIESEYKIYHDIINGNDFLPILNDIKEFITINTSETLILDFQHFKGDSANNVHDFIYENLYKNNLIVVNDTSKTDLEFISNLTLNNARGKCVIFWGDYNSLSLANEKNYLFARNNDECTNTDMSLNSCYISDYNKMSSEDYINSGLPFYYENIKNKIASEHNKGMFVLQGQLTDGKLIFGPWSKEKKHDANMSNYINNLKDSDNLNLTNIIMRDFLTKAKVNQIINLNQYKNNVKNASLTEFTNNYNK